MRALPDDGWSARADGHAVPPLVGEWEELGAVQHGFTHFALVLRLSRYSGSDSAGLPDGEWWPVANLDQAGLPSLFAKAALLAVAGYKGDNEAP